MRSRAYLLLDAVGGKRDEMVRTLRARPGIIAVDMVDGPPEIVMVVEASDRLRLAELTIDALTSVEDMTDFMQLLPTRDG